MVEPQSEVIKEVIKSGSGEVKRESKKSFLSDELKNYGKKLWKKTAEKICPKCKKVYPVETEVCPECNIKLQTKRSSLGMILSFFTYLGLFLLPIYFFLNSLVISVSSLIPLPGITLIVWLIIFLIGVYISWKLTTMNFITGIFTLIVILVILFVALSFTGNLPLREMQISFGDGKVSFTCLFQHLISGDFEGMRYCYSSSTPTQVPPTAKLLEFSFVSPKKALAESFFSTTLKIDLLAKDLDVSGVGIDAYLLNRKKRKPATFKSNVTICPRSEDCLNFEEAQTYGKEVVTTIGDVVCDTTIQKKCNLNNSVPSRNVVIWWYVSCNTEDGEVVYPEIKVTYNFNASVTYKVAVTRVKGMKPEESKPEIYGPVSLSMTTDAENNVYILDSFTKKGFMNIVIKNLEEGVTRLSNYILIKQIHDSRVSSFTFKKCTGTEEILTYGVPGDRTIILNGVGVPSLDEGESFMISCELEVPQDVEKYNEYIFNFIIPYTYETKKMGSGITIDYTTCNIQD
ncbi:MAG: hypothetical protein QW609_02240 [Candidatus Aenigmatarchaeota archaeon]